MQPAHLEAINAVLHAFDQVTIGPHNGGGRIL